MYSIFVGTSLLLLLIWIIKRYLIREEPRVSNGLKTVPDAGYIPIVHIYIRTKETLYHYLMNLRDKYGNIFVVKFGMRRIIVLDDYQIVKNLVKYDGDNLSGRWRTEMMNILTNDNGILFIDGDKWAKQRQFVLKVLRDFGFGKSKSDEIVQSECKNLMEDLDGLLEQTVDFAEFIPIYTANIISKFIMNKHFQRTDPKIKYLEKAIFELTKKKDIIKVINLMFPLFDGSKTLTKMILSISSQRKTFDNIFGIFGEYIEERLKVLDVNSEGDDLMDRFLIEQHRLIAKEGTPDTFTSQQLIYLIFELFGAGYETTSTTLNWAMLFMSRHPDIQDRVHEEIIENIGLERLPTMSDKRFLTYTQAVMDEILRLSSVIPLSLFHRAFNDTSANGFFIPRNSIVFVNLYACHRDPEIWENPMDFYPDHFLKRSHSGDLVYNPRDELIPFGIGKRQCLGESLARMEYFVFFVAILQRFRVTFSCNVTDKEYQDALLGNEGMIRYSKIKNYKFEKILN